MKKIFNAAIKSLPHLTNLTVICGVVLALIQFNHSGKIESAKLMLDFNNQLRNNQNNYTDFLDAVISDRPIVKPKGKFSDIQIDNFLVEWELLNQMRENKLISEDMSYDAFAYEVEATWCNKDINKFINDGRKENNSPDLYGGFEELANHYLKKDKMSCEKINK
jgi:hypothetical protein